MRDLTKEELVYEIGILVKNMMVLKSLGGDMREHQKALDSYWHKLFAMTIDEVSFNEAGISTTCH